MSHESEINLVESSLPPHLHVFRIPFGTNINEVIPNAFPDLQRSISKPMMYRHPHSIEAVLMGLSVEGFVPNEFFRAYPIIPAAVCREQVKMLNVQASSFEDVEALGTAQHLDSLHSLTMEQNKNVPGSMWEDLASLKIINVNNVDMSIEATFHIPKTMEQDGWLLVFSPEETVNG